jgi:hypothetical protein
MAEEMIESVPWESEEAEFGESEESIEAEESVGDNRSRRRHRRPFQPQRGVQGMTLRGQDGRPRTLQFPAKLATVSETNRGLATQELGRRALDERLEKLEQKFRSQQKKDIATTGAVTLAIGAGLSAVGAFEVANHPAPPALATESTLKRWSNQDVTKMATVASLTQLATSGAKLAFNGQYIRSGFGIAADVFSVLQLGLFSYGALQSQPVAPPVAPAVQAAKVTGASRDTAGNYQVGTPIVDINGAHKMYVVVAAGGQNYFVPQAC